MVKLRIVPINSDDSDGRWVDSPLTLNEEIRAFLMYTWKAQAAYYETIIPNGYAVTAVQYSGR